MAKIAKSTDLTKLDGDPTSRANVDHLPIDDLQLHGWLRRGRTGVGLKLKTRTPPRSNLGTAIAVVLLIAVGCAAVGTLAAIGAPFWLACCGLLLPVAVFFGLRYIG